MSLLAYLHVPVGGVSEGPLAAMHVAGLARDLEAGAVEHAGQTFAQQDVVGREHYTGADCVHTDD